MGLLQGVVKEEGFIFMTYYVVLCPDQKGIGHVFIHPSGRFPSLHEPDPGDAIDNAAVMPVVPIHFQQFGVIPARGLPREIFPVIHFDGIVRIQPADPPVFNIDRGNTVLGGCQDIGIIKTHLVGSRGNRPVPVHHPVSQSQVPFSHNARMITLPL